MAVTAFIAFTGFRHYTLLTREMKLLTLYFFIDCSCSFAGMMMGNFQINNLWLMNLQIPLEFGFFMMALSYWVNNSTAQRLFRFSIPVYTITWLILFLTIEPFFEFSKISRPLLSAIILPASVYVLVQIIRDTTYPILLQTQFWISAGVLIYNAGNATFYLITNVLFTLSGETLVVAWLIHNLIGIFSYFLYASGFLCLQAQLKSSGR